MFGLQHVFIAKFIKFCVVGCSGMLIDFGLTFLFKEKLKSNAYLANAIGFVAAASGNYFLNRIWTFHSHNPEIGLEYTLFIGIAAIGLLINTAILWFLTERLKMNFYFSKVIAIGITTLWNFAANFLYTFST